MKKMKAFSLAEALITLLIICIITIASIPVLTKKHRTRARQSDENLSHGSYACFIVNGKYFFSSKNNDVEKSGFLDTDFCEFTPPTNGRDFVVTVIGGGGGGGCGYSTLSNKIFMASGVYDISESGKYNMVVVGAGGGGTDYSSYVGGGSGGYDTAAVDLIKGDMVSVIVGSGGSARRVVKNGESQIVVPAGNGGSTQIVAGSYALVATGGYANNMENRFCYGFNGNYDGCGGSPNGSETGYDSASLPKYSKKEPFLSMIPPNLTPSPGAGGGMFPHPRSSNEKAVVAMKGKGADGFAAIGMQKKLCGEGGDAGIISVASFNKLANEKIQIKIGIGGKGSLNKDSSSTKGGTSKFANLVIASGGMGGNSTNSCIYADINGENKALGKHSQASALVNDTNSYGACGGNQACATANTDGKIFNASSPNENGLNALYYGAGGGGGSEGGKGGDGANGIVFIKW